MIAEHVVLTFRMWILLLTITEHELGECHSQLKDARGQSLCETTLENGRMLPMVALQANHSRFLFFYLGMQWNSPPGMQYSNHCWRGEIFCIIIRILWVILVEVACCNNWDSWSLMPFLWLEMCLNFSQNSRRRKECFAKHVEVSWNGVPNHPF